MKDIIVPDSDWRGLLGLKPKTATRVNIQILNAVMKQDGTLHRWLHRQDVLAVLYREAERLESKDMKQLADRIQEATRKE